MDDYIRGQRPGDILKARGIFASTARAQEIRTLAEQLREHVELLESEVNMLSS